MELKRNYLTSEELIGIVNELIQHESAIEREIIKVGMVAQCLIDGMDEYKDCNAMYDAVMENGIDFDCEVNNYYMIDKLIKEEIGVEKVIKDFVNSIGDSIKDIPSTLDIQNLMTQMKEVIK